MGRLARSYALFVASLRVLRAHKGLAWFTVLAGVAGLFVAGAFLTPAFFLSHVEITDHGRLTAGSWVLLAAFYLVSAFVTIFFNAGLISQADVALRGGSPAVGAGLAAAASRRAGVLRSGGGRGRGGAGEPVAGAPRLGRHLRDGQRGPARDRGAARLPREHRQRPGRPGLAAHDVPGAAGRHAGRRRGEGRRPAVGGAVPPDVGRERRRRRRDRPDRLHPQPGGLRRAAARRLPPRRDRHRVRLP